jgi:hypothetical protein
MASWRFRDAEFVYRGWDTGSEEEAFLRRKLEQLRLDPVAMLEVRRLVRERTGTDLRQLSDEEALAEFARLFAVTGDAPAPRRTGGGAAADAASSTAAPPAPSPRPPASREREPESPTFPPDHAPSAQAAALTAAALTGVPFCEECARAAAERAAGLR